MADRIERKRVTLHPLKEDGSINTKVNLYPKTFIDGIVDHDGIEIEVATAHALNQVVDGFDERLDTLETEVASKQNTLIAGNNIRINDNVISTHGVATLDDLDDAAADINDEIDQLKQDTQTELDNKQQKLKASDNGGIILTKHGDYTSIEVDPEIVVSEEELQNAVSTLEGEISTAIYGAIDANY